GDQEVGGTEQGGVLGVGRGGGQQAGGRLRPPPQLHEGSVVHPVKVRRAGRRPRPADRLPGSPPMTSPPRPARTRPGRWGWPWATATGRGAVAAGGVVGVVALLAGAPGAAAAVVAVGAAGAGLAA